MTDTRIPGASVWEQAVYDHLVGHTAREIEILRAYEQAAEETTSPAFTFLARLILDDERRHHQLLRDLADSIRTSAELTGAPTPIPDLQPVDDREHLLELTDRFLDVERADERDLAELAKMLRDVRDTTLWGFVIRLIQLDNAKHREILEFVKAHTRRSH
jgi:hypothetical protein